MKFERFTFVFFLLGIFLVGSVLAENVNGTEWTDVPGIGCRGFENETHSGQICAEFNGTGWNTNTTGINISSEEPFGPLLGFVSVSEATQKDYNIQEINVTAQMAATEYWAEIELNKSNIDFGNVEKGNEYKIEYKIWAKGNIDITVTPTLKNLNDNIFSNLYFSRTSVGGFTDPNSKIGDYSMRFNLTSNKSEWLGIGASKMEKRTSANGKQYLKLDLNNFEGIIPFDEERNNTIKFLITPIWNENAGRRID